MSAAGEVAAAVRHAIAVPPIRDLPLPGSGRTAQRLAALQDVGCRELSEARLIEAHADAVAILAELGEPQDMTTDLWGVWAAEPPSPKVVATRHGQGWLLSGHKPWCSGAGVCDRALVTAETDQGSRLFAVQLDQAGVRPADDGWPVAALRETDTRTVVFSEADATAIGAPGDYVGRPGFWHGAVGVAAVWLGGAVAVARVLRDAQCDRDFGDIEQMQVGAVDVALYAAQSSLWAAAASIDGDARDHAGRAAVLARRVRAVVEATVAEVIERVGRALGPVPLAYDAGHAHRIADLELYVRQSHAERDLVDLGKRLGEAGDSW